MRQEPRLQFTKEERADPVLEKPIRKADRAADKAEKARAKIPKKKIRFEETVTDPATGKTVTRLRFEEVDKKKPPSKLSHAVRDAPGNAILSKVHKEIRESEEDNVGVESAHKMEEAAETGGRMIESAYHSHKLKPYREAAKAEKKLEKPPFRRDIERGKVKGFGKLQQPKRQMGTHLLCLLPTQNKERTGKEWRGNEKRNTMIYCRKRVIPCMKPSATKSAGRS